MVILVVRVILGAVLFVGVESAGGILLVAFGTGSIPAPPSNPLPWNLASALGYSAVLAWVAYRVRPRGWHLALVIGTLLFAIMHFASLLEARFFGLFGTAQTVELLAMELVTTIVFAPVFVLLLRPPDVLAETQRAPAAMTAMRLGTAALAYLVVYFAAGMMVFPFVRDFYATKPMPNGLAVIAMQLLVRGPLFAACIYMLARVSFASRRETVLMAGAVMSVLGGLGLIVPNPFMPDFIRWPHLIEVGTSNFAWGCFAAWLVTRRSAAAVRHVEPQVAV